MSNYLGVWVKQPGEVKDYDVDYTDWLAEITPAVSVASTSITITCLNGSNATLTSSYEIASPFVKVWLTAGATGFDYKVTVRSTMTGIPARIDEREFKIKVREQ